MACIEKPAVVFEERPVVEITAGSSWIVFNNPSGPLRPLRLSTLAERTGLLELLNKARTRQEGAQIEKVIGGRRIRLTKMHKQNLLKLEYGGGCYRFGIGTAQEIAAWLEITTDQKIVPEEFAPLSFIVENGRPTGLRFPTGATGSYPWQLDKNDWRGVQESLVRGFYDDSGEASHRNRFCNSHGGLAILPSQNNIVDLWFTPPGETDGYEITVFRSALARLALAIERLQLFYNNQGENR